MTGSLSLSSLTSLCSFHLVMEPIRTASNESTSFLVWSSDSRREPGAEWAICRMESKEVLLFLTLAPTLVQTFGRLEASYRLTSGRRGLGLRLLPGTGVRRTLVRTDPSTRPSLTFVRNVDRGRPPRAATVDLLGVLGFRRGQRFNKPFLKKANVYLYI